jgi:hypothetical protein
MPILNTVNVTNAADDYVDVNKRTWLFSEKGWIMDPQSI